jgi:hypothetical protein
MEYAVAINSSTKMRYTTKRWVMSQKKIRVSSLAVLLMTLPLAAHIVQDQADTQGFIYGRVVTESGTEYQGFLRWGTQEAFWDDLFHSSKVDLPYLDYLDEDEYDDLNRNNRRRISIFGLNINIEGDFSSSRQFISRFGDIERIEPLGGGEAVVYMKNGNEYDVSGGSDDVSNRIHVTDASLGNIDIRWDRIELIEFMEAPRDAAPPAWRLYGTVETYEMDYVGFIQWDKEECLNTDVLDGDTDDGDISVQMGSILSIERRSSRRSLVTLRDGRELRLHGSNDVNEENRGIMIEDERYGRVTIDWDSFDKVTFSEPGSSGRGYDNFVPLGELSGTVIDEDGERFSGQIVFDVDESEAWEMLNGHINGIEFDIPFSQVVSVEPLRGGRARVELLSGESLTLEDTADVSEENAGVLVLHDRTSTYVSWDEIERIEFNN